MTCICRTLDQGFANYIKLKRWNDKTIVVAPGAVPLPPRNNTAYLMKVLEPPSPSIPAGPFTEAPAI